MKKLFALFYIFIVISFTYAQNPFPLQMEGKYTCKINKNYTEFKFFRRSLTDSLKINISTDSTFNNFSTCSIDSGLNNSFSYYKSTSGPNGFPFNSVSVSGRYYISFDSIYYITTVTNSPPWHQFTTTCECLRKYPVSIIENHFSNFKFYPNPSNGFIQISGLNEKANYSIISINGQLLKEGIIFNSSEFINLEELKSGVYFVKIYNEISVSVRKIILN